MAFIKVTLAQLVREGKVLIDSDDLIDYISCAARSHSEGYILVRVKGTDHYLHRLIMGADVLHVDHINGIKHDNRRCNLRLATHSQNQGNSVASVNSRSGYKGVALHKDKYWAAGIMKNRKQIHIGYFKTPEEAALAYNKKALELFGEFAYQNTIPEDKLNGQTKQP